MITPTDTTNHGQLWVKDNTIDELYFTTNSGDDIKLLMEQL